MKLHNRQQSYVLLEVKGAITFCWLGWLTGRVPEGNFWANRNFLYLEVVIVTWVLLMDSYTVIYSVRNQPQTQLLEQLLVFLMNLECGQDLAGNGRVCSSQNHLGWLD